MTFPRNIKRIGSVDPLDDDPLVKERSRAIAVGLYVFDQQAAPLARLSPKCKAVFLMSRKDCKSYKVISENLNISVSTVEKHIVKALKIMRNSLNEYMD